MPNLTLSEKRTIYNVLTLIMKADCILNPTEVSFLDRVFEDFQLSYDEFDHTEDLDLDVITADFALFSDDIKEYAKQLFVEMSECDGYVDPREVAIIKKLSL